MHYKVTKIVLQEQPANKNVATPAATTPAVTTVYAVATPAANTPATYVAPAPASVKPTPTPTPTPTPAYVAPAVATPASVAVAYVPPVVNTVKPNTNLYSSASTLGFASAAALVIALFY
ncbi:UNVERIFIED_CONTAM: hypothetical protein HDU68_010414 [Siphonaria sp. JEL0065]|nr:hypothetical protein HDU68_010414 [Siphonaria sp. JEL0065]